jgi:hypothetical protein
MIHHFYHFLCHLHFFLSIFQIQCFPFKSTIKSILKMVKFAKSGNSVKNIHIGKMTIPI